MKKIVFDLIKSPLWIFALFTGAKSFRDNPVIGSVFLNRCGLHGLRVRVAYTLARYRRLFLKKLLTAQQQEEYKTNGYIVEREFLGKENFNLIKKEVFDSIWALREMKQGNTITRRVFLDHTTLEATHPNLAAFIRNPDLLATIRYVAGIGGEPIFSIQAVLIEANTTNDPQMVVHADTFHPNAKAWFFLENVGAEDGPFAYVKGSHVLTPERLQWEKQQSLTAKHHPIVYHARGSFRATQKDLKEMNLPDPVKMTVSENTLVVADTFGFHCRSGASHNTCRVELYATLRRNPFIPWLGFDLFSLPYIKNRSGSCSIALLSVLSKIGLRKMPWKFVRWGRVKDSI